MEEVINLSIEEDLAIISFNNPPVNSLGLAVRKGLVEALNVAESNVNVRAIILIGEGSTFPAGADIKEFGHPPQEPHLPAICDKIEKTKKPVISALHGTALGGGLEIALSSHYRIASEKTKIGLPEVHLGLLPGAGGTQRLPRLAGIVPALKIMTSGKPISSTEALKIGIIDKITEDLLLNAKTFARENMGKNNYPITSKIQNKIIDSEENRGAINAFREELQKKARGLLAPQKIVDCVEASLSLKIEDGLKFERNAFSELMTTKQSKALIHAFFAERKSAKIPEIARATHRAISSLGVIGGGTMGSGITVAALNAGLHVKMIEKDKDSIDRGIRNVRKVYERDVEKGRMNLEKKEKILSNYEPSTDMQNLSQVDMVIEAVYEEMEIKKSVFRELDKIAKDGAVLASNTSYLNIDEIASVTKRPQDVIGLHFFSPANIMRLLEIVIPGKVADDVVATGFHLAKRMKKVPVRAGNCDGFIGNRILSIYGEAAGYIMEDGASPYEIDKAIVNFGYPMGPYQMFDLAGGDIGWATRKRKSATRNPKLRYVEISDRLCENGWFGQKTGRGFYRYTEGERRGKEDPEVLDIIRIEREKKGIKPKHFSEEEILRRYLGAMINESAKVIEENMALRPSDIDVTKLYGYGFPRYKGGPMHYADTYGLNKILDDLNAFSEEDPVFWSPSQLIVDLVSSGKNFNSLNK